MVESDDFYFKMSKCCCGFLEKEIWVLNSNITKDFMEEVASDLVKNDALVCVVMEGREI